METANVTIAGKSFPLISPYAAGHPLTEGEARQLNQVRHENVRNNLAKFVKDNPENLSAEDMAAKVALSDEAYEFGIRAAGTGGVSRDPVQTEARSLVRASIKSQLKNAGKTKTADEINEAIDKFMASEKAAAVLEMAAKRVADKQAAAEAILADVA